MKFYVYELVVMPDEVVCYVGKGTRKRMWLHRSNALRTEPASGHGNQSRLLRKLRELLASGKDFTPRRVFETDDEEAAIAEEQRRILLYGLENLYNVRADTRGTTVACITRAHGFTPRRARNERVAKNLAEHGHKMDPETRAKIAAGNRGKKMSLAFVEKLKAAHVAGKFANCSAEHLRGAWKGRKQTTEHVNNSKRWRRGAKDSPETIAKRAASNRGKAGRKSKWGRGVVQRGGRFVARICADKQVVNLGSFKTWHAALVAYDDAFEQRFGSRPNDSARTYDE